MIRTPGLGITADAAARDCAWQRVEERIGLDPRLRLLRHGPACEETRVAKLRFAIGATIRGAATPVASHAGPGELRPSPGRRETQPRAAVTTTVS